MQNFRYIGLYMCLSFVSAIRHTDNMTIKKSTNFAVAFQAPGGGLRHIRALFLVKTVLFSSEQNQSL